MLATVKHGGPSKQDTNATKHRPTCRSRHVRCNRVRWNGPEPFCRPSAKCIITKRADYGRKPCRPLTVFLLAARSRLLPGRPARLVCLSHCSPRHSRFLLGWTRWGNCPAIKENASGTPRTPDKGAVGAAFRRPAPGLAREIVLDVDRTFRPSCLDDSASGPSRQLLECNGQYIGLQLSNSATYVTQIGHVKW